MEMPSRSPKAVSENIRELIQGKVVCELGCAEGDNMIFMDRYATKVVGLDINPKRLEIALKQGLSVFLGDYRVDNLPIVDVYYFWPSNVERDTPFLIRKLINYETFNGLIIAGGDGNLIREKYIIYLMSYFGRLIKVPFNEGIKYRQRGIFYLAIIDKKTIGWFKHIFMNLCMIFLRLTIYIKSRILKLVN